MAAAISSARSELPILESSAPTIASAKWAGPGQARGRRRNGDRVETRAHDSPGGDQEEHVRYPACYVRRSCVTRSSQQIEINESAPTRTAIPDGSASDVPRRAGQGAPGETAETSLDVRRAANDTPTR